MARLEGTAVTVWRDRAARGVQVVSLTAALALVAQSEWMLARAVGWPVYVALLAPVALDAYVLAAVLTGRDLRVAVTVSAVSVLASHGLYAARSAWEGGVMLGGGSEPRLVWPLAAICSVVPLLVMARIHSPAMSARPSAAAPPDERSPGPIVSTLVSGEQLISDRPPDLRVSEAVSACEPGGERSVSAEVIGARPPLMSVGTRDERIKWARRHASRNGAEGLAQAIATRWGVSPATARRDAAATRQEDIS